MEMSGNNTMRGIVSIIVAAMIVITYLALTVMYPSHPISDNLEKLLYIAIGFLFNTGEQVTRVIVSRLGLSDPQQ
jgi:hypothetical protein